MDCRRCGNCCRWSFIRSAEPLKVDILLEYRGAEQVDDHTIRVPLACRFLGEDGLCAIYKCRPQVCRDYPSEGHIRPKECKYQ